MKYLIIIFSLVLLNLNVDAQSINFKQRKQLQGVGIKNQQKINKKLTALDRKKFRQMQNEADSVARISSPRLKSIAIKSFNRKYSTFRTGVLQKANISNDIFFNEVKSIMPNAKLKKSKNGFFAINKNVLQNRGPKVKVDPKFKRITQKNKVVKVKSKDNKKATGFSSTNPSIRFELEGCSGNNYNGQFKDDNGFSSFSSAAVAGGCETKRGTGNNVVVPSGVKRVRVRITLPDGFDLSATAFGAMGYGHCQTEIGIRVKGPGMEEYFKDSEIICIAPVVYFAEVDSGELDHYEMEASFVPRQNGGTYRIQAYGKTFSMGIAGGMGVGYTSVDEVSNVDVVFEY